MRPRPDASSQELAAARLELGAALAGERSAEAAVRRPAATLAALVLVAIVLTSGLATTWIENDDEVSSPVWWALFVLFALALLLLLAAAFAVAVAARPRGRSGDLLEHIPALRESEDAGAAVGDLVDVAAAAERSRRGIETALVVATIALGLAGGAIAAQGVTFALGTELRPSGAQPDPLAPDPFAALAERHAPAVWLHPDERYGPLDPAMFLRKAALRWRRPGADRLIIRAGQIDAARLGSSCREEACAEYGPFLSNQLTRPFSGGTQRPRRLPQSRGMYLEEPDSLRRGQLVPNPPVPVFYEVAHEGESSQITFWLFFGASTQPARRRQPPREGDWEWFTLRLDATNRPESVTLRNARFAWKNLRVVEGHPELYATLGGHALHAGPCPRKRCRLRPRLRGLRWSTGKDVRNVRAQDWYGFGGAWGHAGRRARIGPLGPSAYR